MRGVSKDGRNATRTSVGRLVFRLHRLIYKNLAILEVLYFDVSPFFFKIFCNKTTVTVMRFVFAAKETTFIQTAAIDILNLPLRH